MNALRRSDCICEQRFSFASIFITNHASRCGAQIFRIARQVIDQALRADARLTEQIFALMRIFGTHADGILIDNAYDREAIAELIGLSTRGTTSFVHNSSARSAISVSNCGSGCFGRSPQYRRRIR